ncbi:MAG: hypothetical protein R3264_07015, partial [Anaerolineae bacterium]|nr:hypothetical protein [Anaerolineae bacterium]
MKRHRHTVLSAEVLLLAFITVPTVEAHQLLRDLSRERGFDWDTFEKDVDRMAGDRRRIRDENFFFETDDKKRVSLSEEIIIILDEGLGLAEAEGTAACTSVHALAIMATIQIGTHWLLNRRGITEKAILDPVYASEPDSTPTVPKQLYLYHRTELQDKLLNILSLRSSRHVILVGPAGVGKRSLVLSISQLIAQGNGPLRIKSVVEIDERGLLDDPLKAVQSGLRKAKGGILFVPDIARFFGGIRAEFREEAGNALQKGFLSDDVVIIGTATQELFDKKLREARVITEHCQVLPVPPTTIDETVEILNILHPKFERDYGLTIAPASLNEVARLAGRFYAAEPLPGAAVHLLHQA